MAGGNPMTITLAPQIETRLRRKAARTGEDADALVELLLSDALSDEASEEELREEYRHLAGLELHGNLSEAQSARLNRVTRALNDLEAHSPAAQAMSQRLDETGHKLDEMLAILRGLPTTAHTPDQHHTILSRTDWQALTQMGDSPPPPTEAMQELAARRRLRHHA